MLRTLVESTDLKKHLEGEYILYEIQKLIFVVKADINTYPEIDGTFLINIHHI